MTLARWILLLQGVGMLLGALGMLQTPQSIVLDPSQPLPEDLEGVDMEELRKGASAIAKVIMAALVGMGSLSLVSAWGLWRNQAWAKWTGIVSGIFQLPIGAIVIWKLWNWDPEEEQDVESQHPDDRENPFITGLRMVATFGLLALACSQLYRFTESIGLPRTNLGDFALLYLFAGQFVVTILHELGHLFAALTVGFRFQVINVGPVTIYKDARGRRSFEFDIKRIFSHSGFLGAIPKSEENLRSNMMIIVFAGPFVSLNIGAILFLWMLNTPGTSLAPWGELIGYAAVIFALDFVANLIPLGHCDGSMLIGLGFNNARGKQIVAVLLAAMHGDRADAAVGGSIEEQVTERKKAIEAAQTVVGAAENKAHSAQSYIQLGLAEFQAGSLQEAAEHLGKALEICDSMGGRAHPILRAAALDGLARTLHRQGRFNESRAAGEQALEIYEQSKEEMPSMEALLEINLNIAELQLALRRFGDAVMTVEQAVASLPGGAGNALMTARLYRAHAAAMLAGKSAQAASSVRRAVQALESRAMPAKHLEEASLELGALASDLWDAGSDEAALQLATRASERLKALGAPADLQNRHRMALASMLTRMGRTEESAAILESITGTSAPSARKVLLEEMGELQIRTNRMEDALTSYAELMRLVSSDPKEAASVKVSLALVHEAMKNGEEAQTWARDACNTLVPIEHPDAAEALFALARAMWTGGDDNAEAYFEEGRRILKEAVDVTPANKARALESALPRFEAHNLNDPANQLRRDAAQLRGGMQPVRLAAPAAVEEPAGDEADAE